MEPTPVLRARLRRLLNEVGPESDTNFTDAEIDELLREADGIYAAASAGWMEKAGMLQGDIESYSTGTEKYDLTSLRDRLDQALSIARQYAQMAESAANGGSFMLRVQAPRVL
ncbi:hypothetical protein ABEV00_21870 [Paenibacillus thiaminolyticus]|uniref:hypothetical protein n=1 Tax=Paenibacillus thiaminolyticus TaxID=49283 RepID=UPI003D280B84